MVIRYYCSGLIGDIVGLHYCQRRNPGICIGIRELS